MNLFKIKSLYVGRHGILYKIGVVFIVAMICLPSPVKAYELISTKIQPKFMSGLSLSGKVFCQSIYKSCAEFSVIVFDGCDSVVKTGTENLPGFNSLFSSAAPKVVSNSDTSNRHGNTTSNYGSYDWWFQVSIWLLIIWVPLGSALVIMWIILF